MDKWILLEAEPVKIFSWWRTKMSKCWGVSLLLDQVRHGFDKDPIGVRPRSQELARIQKIQFGFQKRVGP